MDLLDKLKMFRDDLNLLIEAEEKKRPYQSDVAKSFQQKLSDMMQKKYVVTGENIKPYIPYTSQEGTLCACEVVRKKMLKISEL